MQADIETAQLESLVIDARGRNVIWLDAGRVSPRIQLATLSGDNQIVLISHGIVKPHSLAVDAENGRVYFADLGEKISRIDSVLLDGTQRRTLVGFLYYIFFYAIRLFYIIFYTKENFGRIFILFFLRYTAFLHYFKH